MNIWSPHPGGFDGLTSVILNYFKDKRIGFRIVDWTQVRTNLMEEYGAKIELSDINDSGRLSPVDLVFDDEMKFLEFKMRYE